MMTMMPHRHPHHHRPHIPLVHHPNIKMMNPSHPPVQDMDPLHIHLPFRALVTPLALLSQSPAPHATAHRCRPLRLTRQFLTLLDLRAPRAILARPFQLHEAPLVPLTMTMSDANRSESNDDANSKRNRENWRKSAAKSKKKVVDVRRLARNAPLTHHHAGIDASRCITH